MRVRVRVAGRWRQRLMAVMVMMMVVVVVVVMKKAKLEGFDLCFVGAENEICGGGGGDAEAEGCDECRVVVQAE